jgi:NTE family protein
MTPGTTNIGLVLGAGGVAGGAWHAGVLAAVAEETGWDARSAAVVVGTSAGSITGAALRSGVAPRDLHAMAVGASLSAEGSALFGRVRSPDGFRAAAGRTPRPANPTLGLRSLARLDLRPGVALAGMLPAGTIDTAMISNRVEELAGGPAWPGAPLWVVAVRLADGRRVVFGRDEVDGPVRLGSAVAASSAIPGFFAPVEIGGARYVDGGVHSPTNGDLLRNGGFDLVVISAPMAGTWRSMRAHPTALARTGSRLALDVEVAALRRSGTEVLVFIPGPADTPVMDGRSMDPASRKPVATRARESALEVLARPSLQTRVSALRNSKR